MSLKLGKSGFAHSENSPRTQIGLQSGERQKHARHANRAGDVVEAAGKACAIAGGCECDSQQEEIYDLSSARQARLIPASCMGQRSEEQLLIYLLRWVFLRLQRH